MKYNSLEDILQDKTVFPAHIRKTENGYEVQTVKEHLTAVAEYAREFADSFGEGDEAYLCGLMHDIGKYSDGFRRRICGGPSVDHATAGAVECMNHRHGSAAMTIAGHHSGIPDLGSSTDTVDNSTFFARIKQAKNGLLEDYSAWQNDITLPSFPPKNYDAFMTRMLFSALKDADCLDTERFMCESSIGQKNEISLEILRDRILDYIKPWYPAKGRLNRERCKILDSCLSHGKDKKGLFRLTVPTGAGKTVSSLAFAITHALENHMDRVIYVIPYTSIIEQTAATFRTILGENAVLEHHSLADHEEDGETEQDANRRAKATENWDMPVIVTSSVQFFESLYSNRTSKCRKLHNMANSVIIFDEAQMLPIPYLIPCVNAIADLVTKCRSSCVLCTATQPSLAGLFRDDFDRSTAELCPVDLDTEVFRRVTFSHIGTLSIDSVHTKLSEASQVLCIVNSKRSAKRIFDLLPSEGRFHLSTLMIPQDRRTVLAEIQKRLSNGLTCRVVSTSLIEAGIDIDFPAVFREEAGLDSILQAAGRCNREGKRDPESSIVTIFNSGETPPALFSQSVFACRMALKNANRPDSAETIDRYFRELYGIKGTAALDQKNIVKLSEQFRFREIAEVFHLIENNTKTVIIPKGEGEFLVRQLREGRRDRNIFRLLGKYSVSLFDRDFAELHSCGALEMISADVGVLLDMSLYSENTGLALGTLGGQALFVN